MKYILTSLHQLLSPAQQPEGKHDASNTLVTATDWEHGTWEHCIPSCGKYYTTRIYDLFSKEWDFPLSSAWLYVSQYSPTSTLQQLLSNQKCCVLLQAQLNSVKLRPLPPLPRHPPVASDLWFSKKKNPAYGRH